MTSETKYLTINITRCGVKIWNLGIKILAMKIRPNKKTKRQLVKKYFTRRKEKRS